MSPNGEPPFGGSKMPASRSCSVLPLGVRSGGVDGGAYGAAAVGAQNEQEGNMEHGDRVLDGPQDRLGDDLAGIADDERVTEPQVEEDLGGQTRVAAPEDGGDRRLGPLGLRAPFGVLPRMLRRTRYEALVAGHQLGPGLCGSAVGHP